MSKLIYCISHSFGISFKNFLQQKYNIDSIPIKEIIPKIHEKTNVSESRIRKYFCGLKKGNILGNLPYVTDNINSLPIEYKLAETKNFLEILEVPKNNLLFKIISNYEKYCIFEEIEIFFIKELENELEKRLKLKYKLNKK